MIRWILVWVLKKTPIAESEHCARMIRIAELCAAKAPGGEEKNPGMSDLFQAFMHDGPKELNAIAEAAGVNRGHMSVAALHPDVDVEREEYALVLGRAHKLAANDLSASKVRIEHLFVALFECIARPDCRSTARQALFEQGLDPAAVLASVREGIAAPPKQP